MKKHRSVRGKVGVERGLGPRHAFNAQEGSEAVPSPLPEPPAEDLRVRPNSFGNLRPALLAKALGEELGSLSKEDVAKMAVAGLLTGGEGGELVPKGEAQPMLTRANRNGSTIRASFDATGSAPDPKMLEQQFKDAGHNVSVTKFGTDLISATKGEHNYRIDVWEPWGKDSYRLSSDAAAKAMEGMFGADAPYRGQTQFEQAVPLSERYGAAHEYGSKKLTDAQLAAQEEDRKGKAKVGVAKGFGPGHAENSKEGDLTKVNTDTVPAMLTPREAVLNRNAAELAGRPEIEKLNAEGNALARKGVDLAAKGDNDVDITRRRDITDDEFQSMADTDKNETMQRLLGPLFDDFIAHLKDQGRFGEVPWAASSPEEYNRYLQNKTPMEGVVLHKKGTKEVMKSKPKQSKPQSGSPYVQAFQKLMPKGAPVGYEQGVSGVPQMQRPMPNPMAPPSPQPRPQGGMPPAQMPPIYNGGGGLFPPRQTVGLASGTGSVPLPGPIGTPPQGEEAYGPPVNLTAPQIQRLAQQTGLSAGQIQGLMSAVKGIGGMGGNANAAGTGTLIDSGGMAYPTTGGYQGGISDIGYPPFVAPNAQFHGDKGGWLGPYDPAYTYNSYARGISSVPFR